jgi:hypothetical protein
MLAMFDGRSRAISRAIAILIVGSDQTLADRGEHELRGIPGVWRVFAVRG